MLLESRLEPVDHRVDLGPVERSGEVLHDPGVGIDRGERLPVLVAPPPQHQPLGAQLRHHPGRVRRELLVQLDIDADMRQT